MPESNPVAFGIVGSVPIHELDPVNELAETRLVRPPGGGSNKRSGGSVIQTISSRAGYWIAGKKIDRFNRYGLHPRADLGYRARRARGQRC